MVMGVSNVEIAFTVKGDAVGAIQSCLRWMATVTPVARISTLACEGGDVATRIHFSDTTVGVICDEEITLGIDCDINRKVERSFSGQSAISAKGGHAITGHGIDDTVGIDLADAIVGRISEIEVTLAVYLNVAGWRCGLTYGGEDLGRDCRASIPGEPWHASPDDGADNAVGIHHADALILLI